MENDKERQGGRKSSSTHSAEAGSSGVFSKISHALRHQKRSLIRFINGPQLEEYRNAASRLFRRGRRVFHTQFADLRRAFLDLRSRITKELDPESGIPEQKPNYGTPLVAPRENTSSTSFTIRPAVLAEPAMKFRRILVVGGMDFFGLALVRHLNRRGIRDIVIVDSLEDERWKNLAPLRFEELISPEEFASGLEPRARGFGAFSHVFYLMGWDGKDSPLTPPKSLLSRVVETGGRFISLGSACSLGPNPNRKDLMLGRPENFRPETRPGVLACLFDRYAMAQLPARNYLSLKHYPIFGPHERRDDSIYGLVKMLHGQIAETGVAVLPENLRPDSPEGIRKHDFVYVRDAARIAAFLAESEDAAGLYEIGSGTSSTIPELVHAVFEAMGRKPEIQWVQAPCALPSPKPEKADLTRLREAGWTQQPASLKEGLRDYLDNSSETDVPREEEEPETAEGATGEKIVLSPVVPPARIFPARRKPFSPKTAV